MEASSHWDPMHFPRIVYNAVTLDATLPARPLRHELPRAVGGGIGWSAAGVPAAWVTRWERLLTVAQRIAESEWPAFRAWLEHAMQGGSFTWALGPGGDPYTCYLVKPDLTAGGELPRLDYPGDHELVYTIRRADGVAIDEASFP